MTVAVVRRLIVFALLFALVTIAAVGLAGLLERVIGLGTVLVVDTAGLARALAFVLVGAPLALVVWRWQRRRLAEPLERASLVWSVYLAAMTLTSLTSTVIFAASAVTSAVEGEWRPDEVAAALVWAGVWMWHRRMRRSPDTVPTRLPALGTELSALFGLIVAAFCAGSALAALISRALASVAPVLFDSRPWYLGVLQPLVWAAIGMLVWWWHWAHERASRARDALALVLLVTVVSGSASASLFGIGTVLHTVLRLLFDVDPVAEILSPLGAAVAAGLVGAIVCVGHLRMLPGRPPRVRVATRLAVCGAALIGAASGFGVVVNALLAGLDTTLVSDDPRTLLLGGLSALTVGVATWWPTWRPAHAVTVAESGDIGRRVYLVVVFGVSAVVALVTLLLIGFRLFETLLGSGGDPGDVSIEGGLIERIRAPLGLLSAMVLVFVYHFVVWRRDRALAPPVSRVPRVERVVLVAGRGSDPLAQHIREATGARVTLWEAADDRTPGGEADADAIVRQLQSLTAPRALVVAGAGLAPRVIPLSGPAR
ncbi:DUF5671 domain-containing protein [Microbacterium sp. OR21]|uniref:DUF5671 domain-containing protein n=1 Tax=Microbacterium sp. OR21 TaxID=3095346 RepID=UPI0039B3A55A